TMASRSSVRPDPVSPATPTITPPHIAMDMSSRTRLPRSRTSRSVSSRTGFVSGAVRLEVGCIAAHAPAVDVAQPGHGLEPEEHVLVHRQLGHQVQLLEDDDDTVALGPGRAAE